MHPASTAWHKHARGLAAVIEGRGPQGFQSPRSLELIAFLRMLVVSTIAPLSIPNNGELSSHSQLHQLLESISSKRRTFLSREDWQPFRRSWPGSAAAAAQSIIQSAEASGPRHMIDYLIDEAVSISNLNADFAGGLIPRDGDGPVTANRDLASTQSALSESLGILERLEAVLAHMQRELEPASSPPQLPSPPPSSATVMTPSPSPTIATLLPSDDRTHYFGQPLRYNLTSLCRTAAMTLRLLMCNLVTQQGGPDRDRLLLQHRAALMEHAEAVVEAIPYSSRSEIFDAAPMCFVPAFRMAEAVLVREADALRMEGGREGELGRCEEMRELVRRHLEFVASKKIPVKIDV